MYLFIIKKGKGIILTVISVYWIVIHLKYTYAKEGLITTINYKSDPKNDYEQRCSTTGMTYPTYNAAKLTPAQKALAERSWPGKPAD